MRDRIAVLAGATLRETLRDRILLVVVAFAVGLVFFSRVLGWLSIEDEIKIVQDFSLTGMSLLSLFLAMLVGAFSLAREVERRTAGTLLSRDLGRSEFILGKFAGLVSVFWLCLLGTAAVLTAWIFLWGGRPGPALAAAVAGLLVEALLLTSVALFLGALVGPMLAALGTFVFYVAGHTTEALRELTADNANPALGQAMGIVYRVLPNLEDVNFINATTSTQAVAWGDLGLGAVACLCWTAVFLMAAMALFRTREL